MRKINSLFSLLILGLITLSLVSCQEDFNAVGSDIINDPNFEFDLYDQATVIAYSRKANPVQTDNLPVYQLGVFNDAVFGSTEASILSQVTLSQTNPFFGDNPEVKKVILSLPYFSTSSGTGETATFTIDSLFGNSPIKLSIYESNFFLRDFDPASGFDDPQKYYSNQGPQFQNFLGQLLFQTEDFKPNEEAITLNPGTEDEEVLSPRLRIEFTEENHQEVLDFFKEKIIDQEGSDVLLNNTNFKNHFRGIYFIAESVTPDGNLILLDFANAAIDITYERDEITGDDDGMSVTSSNSKLNLMEDERIEATFTLNFGGITLNTFKNNTPPDLEELLNNPNVSGTENLYLKSGGASTITVIELFGEDFNNNNIPDELEDLREKKWIINEANLILNVNKNFINSNSSEPERIYLYDLNNNNILIDYQLDNTSPVSDPLNFKTSHLGRLERDGSGVGEQYKLRITNHISNLINRDSTNVRLGLVVSPNVNVISSKSLLNETPPGIKSVPAASVISPEGTVIHGVNSPNQEKKIKLNIFFTEINN